MSVTTPLDAAIEQNPDAFNFDDIPLPEAVSDQATLDDMLAEGREVRRRGRVFTAIAPSIRELRVILKMLDSVADTEGEAVVRAHVEIARRLLRVRDGDCLRPASAGEIEEAFPVNALMMEITRTMADNGVRLDAGNA
jgi:hypothetical protein